MERKKAMISLARILLVFAMLNVLSINGQIACPWCDKKAETDLLDCVYIETVSRPELMSIPLEAIDNVKWKISSTSDSMVGLPFAEKKTKMDDVFVAAIADEIKQNNYQSNPGIIDVMSDAAGSCYSSVTGYDKNIVINDIKRMVNENIQKSTAPLGNPNPVPNSGAPYLANQNQPSNFQPPQQVIQPSYMDNVPFVQPGSPPVNSFNSPSNVNNAPFYPPGSPPVNSFNNPSNVDNTPFVQPVAPPVKPFNGPSSVNNAPFNSPGLPPVNPSNNPSFDKVAGPSRTWPRPDYYGPGEAYPSNNPSSDYSPDGNWSPYDYPRQGQRNPSNNPSDYNPDGNWPPYDYSEQEQPNSSNNPSVDNNTADSSVNRTSYDYDGQGTDSSKSQKPPDDSSDTSLQNEYVSQSTIAVLTTASPKISSPSEDSLSNTDSLDTSNKKTTPPTTDAPQIKTTQQEKSDDEQPCDEKFKIALYEKLINDNRFREFFEKLPVSKTKPAVLEIIKHVFKKYGVEQHYTEFTTFWKFESKALNKESKAEDWDELISKICKIIFSRNNLLKGDCEEIGRTIADYFMGVFPGDPPASSTKAPIQNGDDSTSTEANASSTSDSTTNTSPENKSNSGNSTSTESPSFPELHSKLSDTFKNDGSTDDVPFSETLAKFEAQQNLGMLHDVAEKCLSPSGFDFDTFLSAMLNVNHSIQANHPDWSRVKCEQETYSLAVAVLAELLQKGATSSSNDAPSQSSSKQPKSDADSGNSQSSNSRVQPDASKDSNTYPDGSEYPWQGTDYDFPDYGDHSDGPGSANVPTYGNQPDSSNWNTGLKQPSNFAPGPVNTNYGNLQNTPIQANQPYNYNYGSPDYGAKIPQSRPQSFISPDYSAIPPTNLNFQPYSGAQPIPVNQNAGIQQSPYIAPNSGFINSQNGNNQFQGGNLGNSYGLNAGPPVGGPVLPNSNIQNFQQQPYQNDYNVPAQPAAGPVLPNSNSQNFQQQPFQPNVGPVLPNGNSQNFQQQPYQNNNYNAPVQPVPVLSNGNSQNFQQQPNQNNYNVPAYGPPNGNIQPGFNSNYNSKFF